MPAKYVAADSQVANLADRLTRPAKPDRAELRDYDFTPMTTQTPDTDRGARACLDAEAIASSFALETRERCATSKEVAVRAIKITQRLLQHITMRLSKPRQRRFEFAKPNALLVVAERYAAEFVGRLPLLKPRVVNRPCTPAPSMQRGALLDGWVQPITVSKHSARCLLLDVARVTRAGIIVFSVQIHRTILSASAALANRFIPTAKAGSFLEGVR